MKQDHLIYNKDLLSIKDNTQELKELIPIIKEDLHTILNTLLHSQVKVFRQDLRIEDIHTNYITFLMESKDKRIAT